MISPINGKINNILGNGLLKKLSIAFFIPDDKKGGKKTCNIIKNITQIDPYIKTLDFFIFIGILVLFYSLLI